MLPYLVTLVRFLVLVMSPWIWLITVWPEEPPRNSVLLLVELAAKLFGNTKAVGAVPD